MSRKAAEYLRPATVILKLSASSISDGIEKMLGAVAGNPDILNLGVLREAVFERQKINPPLLPSGVAFPHARTDSVRALVIVVATVAAPLLTGAVNVRMMFLIGVPKSAAVEYLELMSFLTRTLRTPDAVDRLCRITDKDEFLNAFAGS